jgi:hypothetical protein
MWSKRYQSLGYMEPKKSLITCLGEKSSKEEWMRDRALLRQLLEKTLYASQRDLAQATGCFRWVVLRDGTNGSQKTIYRCCVLARGRMYIIL